ncbi:facilitated trehalose transporter Tret1-like [Leptopilina heterotoma]|uniref:facilitated trehalose transporter Tret1-like n=1 Tax=Leptopilina heterotoma TaxID=63436 RepID=UPI001CA95F05|nr:facilitated trehalose transporter Tret1-like [Leptopilina heterotoma]
MMETKFDEQFRGVIFMQYVAGITSTLVALGFNAMESWTSPALPYLTSEKLKSPLQSTDFDSIASVSILGSFFGFILNPLLVNNLGTKSTLLIFAIPQTISWLMLIFSENLTIICLSRFISGLAYCGALSTLVEYLTSITNSTNRTKFFTIMNLSSNLGNLLPITINLFCTYLQMNIILTTIPIIFIVIFLIMPKSDYFIEMNKWKEEEVKINSSITSPYGFDTFRTAQKNFIDDNISLRNKTTTKIDIIDKDYFILNKLNNQDKLIMNHDKLKLNQDTRKTGHIPILIYTEQFLTHRGSIINGDQASFLLTIIKVVAVLLSTQFTDRIEKKKLLLICGIIGSLSLGFVGLFFFLDTQHYDISKIGWFPLVFITISEIANVIGIGNVFFAFQGELFSNDVQTLAISSK